ncbi:MAG: hypothetical protein Greene041619_932 [Candidatus Peregrinibacteria bacterium Greene0416_19]|nr:MAG: hypothetical protein Greene041619_932 [Candidatus Peregrinibacteria bacterium Greene0416_19]
MLSAWPLPVPFHGERRSLSRLDGLQPSSRHPADLLECGLRLEDFRPVGDHFPLSISTFSSCPFHALRMVVRMRPITLPIHAAHVCSRDVSYAASKFVSAASSAIHFSSAMVPARRPDWKNVKLCARRRLRVDSSDRMPHVSKTCPASISARSTSSGQF